MTYTLFDISKNPVFPVLTDVSKTELIAWMVRQDTWRTRFTPNRVDKIQGNDTKGFSPDEYVPTVFDQMAMNANDKRSLTMVRYTVIQTKPMGSFKPDQIPRQYMVVDEDGRVVDVRGWLNECRRAFCHPVPEAPQPFAAGPEKKDKTVYRKTTGLRQALALPLQLDEDWHELVGNVPSRLTRKPRRNAVMDVRTRSVSRCWKDNPGRTRNWQRDTTGHMPAKTSSPLDFAALSAELIGA